MSAWIVPLALVALLLVLPGTLVCLAAGVRPPTALVTGPAVTLGVVGCSTVVLGRLGVGWTPLTAVGVTALAVLGAGAVRVVLGRRGPVGAPSPGWTEDVRRHWPTAVGLALAALVAGGITAGVIGAPSTVPQGWDVAFHTGYSQWVSSTGEASPLRAGLYQNYDSGTPTFYPSALHAVAALVITLTGSTSVVVLNAVIVVIAALLVPAAAAALAAVAAPGRRWAPGAAALLSTGFSVLPYDQLWRPALPYATAIAAACSALLLLRGAHRSTRVVPVAALAVVGSASAHPSALFFFAVLAGLLVLAVLVGLVPGGRVRVLATTAGTAVLAAAALSPQLLAASSKGSIVTSYDYRLPYPAAESIRRALTFGVDVRPGIPAQLVLTGAVVVGLLVALRHRRTAWLAVCALVLALLAAQAAAPFSSVLSPATSLFYNDPWRIGSLLALVGAALGGLAVDAVARAVGHRAPAAARVVSPVLVLALLATLVLPTVGRNAGRMELGYDGRVVDGPVLEGFAALRELAGTEGRVLNDPYDGSVWMYPVAGVRPVFPHYEVGTLGPRQTLLLEDIPRIATDPEAQAAAAELGVQYVFVSARRIIPGERPLSLASLPTSPGLTEVFDNGVVQIYRIDGAPTP